jgi:GNAT superfamily N-acetyltransferase
MEFSYARLASPASAFSLLTFPVFRTRLERLDQGSKAPLAVGACDDEGPVGLALVDFAEDYAELLSVFVVPDRRRRGIATRLLATVEKEIGISCKSLRVSYEGGNAFVEAVEGLLAGRGFTAPQRRSLVCRCSGTRIRQAPWLKKDLLPAAFSTFSWTELDPDEVQALRGADWYPPLLSPFKEEENVEGLNSLGLRYKGDIVGWQINHRIARDTIRYTTMFVRQDLQAFGLAIPLMIESIRRHLFSGQLWIDKATFVVPEQMQGMVNFVERRMRPYIDAVHPSFEAYKVLS